MPFLGVKDIPKDCAKDVVRIWDAGDRKTLEEAGITEDEIQKLKQKIVQ